LQNVDYVTGTHKIEQDWPCQVRRDLVDRFQIAFHSCITVMGWILMQAFPASLIDRKLVPMGHAVTQVIDEL